MEKFVLLVLSISYIGFNYMLPVLSQIESSVPIGQLGRLLSILLVLSSIKYFFRRAFLKYLLYTVMVIVVWGMATIGQQFFGNTLVNWDASLLGLYSILSTIAIYIVFVYLTENYENSTKIIIIALSFFAFLNVFVAIYCSYTGFTIFKSGMPAGSIGFDEATGRITGFRGENYVGLWTAPLLSFALFSIFHDRTIMKSIAFSIPFILTSLVISLSRTTLATSFMVVIVWAFTIIRKKSRLWLMILSVILVPPTFWVASNALTNQFRSMEDTVIRSEMQRIKRDNRTETWLYWLEVALTNPLGIGSGGINSRLDRFRAVPHNSFLDILVEYGFQGLIIYCIPWWIGLRGIKTVMKTNPYDYELAVLVCSLYGMFISLLLLSNPYMKIPFIVAGCIEGRKMFLQKSQLRIVDND